MDLCSNSLLILKRIKQSTGNPVINDALALHIHISMIDGKLVFQAQQCTNPNRVAQKIWQSRASGR
jgi:hypothetical protein